MQTAPPTGLSWRRPSLADAEAILDFVAAYNTGIVGRGGAHRRSRRRRVPPRRPRGDDGGLRRALRVHAAAGLQGSILHVDTNNATPALGLCESVGMRPVLVMEVWRVTLPVG